MVDKFMASILKMMDRFHGWTLISKFLKLYTLMMYSVLYVKKNFANKWKERNHLLDIISDNERFFHYAQDLGRQIPQCLV